MTSTKITSPLMTENAILAEEPASEMPVAQSNSKLSDDHCWDAVVARDPARDGEFVFAVSTTGVYCRPSCPARRPRRKNVTFYSRPEQAETAGFRACLRCRPKALSGNPLSLRRFAAWSHADRGHGPRHLRDSVRALRWRVDRRLETRVPLCRA